MVCGNGEGTNHEGREGLAKSAKKFSASDSPAATARESGETEPAPAWFILDSRLPLPESAVVSCVGNLRERPAKSEELIAKS